MMPICCAEVDHATDCANCSRGTSSGASDFDAGPASARVVPERMSAP